MSDTKSISAGKSEINNRKEIAALLVMISLLKNASSVNLETSYSDIPSKPGKTKF